jgi:hypothetical protein
MQADIGIAMGEGTDIAIDSADMIVLNNRLEALIDAREISRWSYRKMLQNVALAVAFNGLGVPLAATGLIHPIWAMAAMAVSVTTIFFNSLRGKPAPFLRRDPQRRAGRRVSFPHELADHRSAPRETDAARLAEAVKKAGFTVESGQ